MTKQQKNATIIKFPSSLRVFVLNTRQFLHQRKDIYDIKIQNLEEILFGVLPYSVKIISQEGFWLYLVATGTCRYQDRWKWFL